MTFVGRDFVFLSVLVCLAYIAGAAFPDILLKGDLVGNKFQRFHTKLAESAPEALKSTNHFVYKDSTPKNVLLDYERLGRAPDVTHEVVVAVRQRNVAELSRMLLDVSDPISPNFGHHLTRSEVSDLTSNPSSTAHVFAYLTQRGVSVMAQTPHGDFLKAKAAISTWEKIFNCEFYEFQAKNSSLKLLRTLSYDLENTVAQHVHTVFNIVHFPPPPRKLRGARRAVLTETHLATAQGYVTPAILKSVYAINSSLGSARASQGVYESIGQTYSPRDLTLFQQRFQLPVEPVAHVIGGHNSDSTCLHNGGNDCVEANLDVQYIMAVAPHTPTTYYYWAGEDFMLEWLLKVSNMSSPPQVLSVSYGMDEGYLTKSYAEAFDILAMKLGLQGVTITASSGDDGASGSSARDNAMMCGYRPSFPATSPYVTAVGATMGPESGKAERTCQGDRGGIITTGGGFSQIYDVPSWQRNATQTYLHLLNGTAAEPHAGFNKLGRGYPDVSAMGFNYVIALAHNFTSVSGTSASSPVVAGLIALVNSQRIAAGKSALGFANPALYHYAHRYARDITDGHNKCVAGGTVCCSQGFYASTGWDAVTGWGVIDFPQFLAALMEPGTPRGSPSATPTAPPSGPSPAPSSPRPSAVPTSSPTNAAGWLSITNYATGNCQGLVTSISSIPTGVCTQLYSKYGDVTGSMSYTCQGEDVGQVTYFSDVKCTHETEGTKIFFGCAYHVGSYYDETADTSTMLSCSTGATPLPLLPSYNGKYVLQTSYDSLTGCEENRVSAVDAILQHHCFEVPSQDLSYQFVYPQYYVHDGSGCKLRKLDHKTDLNTQCQSTLDSVRLDTGDDDDTSSVNDIWSLADTVPFSSSPSVQPSRAPSRLPSPASSGEQSSPPSLAHVGHTTSTPTGPTTSTPTGPTTSTPTGPTTSTPTGPTTSTPTGPTTSTPTGPTTSTPTGPTTSTPTGPTTSTPTEPTTSTPTGPTTTPTGPTTSLTPTSLSTLIPSRISTPTPTSISELPDTSSPSSSAIPSTSQTSRPPSVIPTWCPSRWPSVAPTTGPSLLPSAPPTASPTITPSRIPSPMPSKMTTLAPVPESPSHNYTIGLQQVLNGISVAVWRQSADKNFRVFQAAVAATLETMPQSISFVDITDQHKTLMEQSSSTASCLLKYHILANLDALPYSSAEEAVADVEAVITSAVAQGSFDVQLTYFAAALQSGDLMDVSSTSVEVVSVSVAMDSDEESAGAGPWTTAGAVLGALAAVSVLGSAVWYATCSARVAGRYVNVSLDSDSVHATINPLARRVHRVDDDEDVEMELAPPHRTAGSLRGAVK